MTHPMTRRILALIGIVGLVGSFCGYHWPLDFAQPEQLAASSPARKARYANGSFVEDGRILAAQYVTEDETLAGLAFEVDGRTTCYDPDGRSMKKMFLRSPLQFTRIKSGFTYCRPHPVLGGVRAHLAVDYAAPTGAPVWEVAKDGRRSAKVSQKQLIGYAGFTGLSTDPHLDYRISRNGTFVNPLSCRAPLEGLVRLTRVAVHQHVPALAVAAHARQAGLAILVLEAALMT